MTHGDWWFIKLTSKESPSPIHHHVISSLSIPNTLLPLSISIFTPTIFSLAPSPFYSFFFHSQDSHLVAFCRGIFDFSLAVQSLQFNRYPPCFQRWFCTKKTLPLTHIIERVKFALRPLILLPKVFPTPLPPCNHAWLFWKPKEQNYTLPPHTFI